MKPEFETRPTWCAFQWFFPLYLPVWSFVKGLKCWRVHCETVNGVSTGELRSEAEQEAASTGCALVRKCWIWMFLFVSNWLICWFHIDREVCSLAGKSVLGLYSAQKYIRNHSSVLFLVIVILQTFITPLCFCIQSGLPRASRFSKFFYNKNSTFSLSFLRDGWIFSGLDKTAFPSGSGDLAMVFLKKNPLWPWKRGQEPSLGGGNDLQPSFWM